MGIVGVRVEKRSMPNAGALANDQDVAATRITCDVRAAVFPVWKAAIQREIWQRK
jgi:hypothetical protein